MQLTGTIKEIFPERQITEKFAVKEFVISLKEGKYEEHILFQLANQNIDLLDPYVNGEEVTVHFSIGGRKAKDRYWNTLKAFKIEDVQKKTTQTKPKAETFDCNDDFKTPEKQKKEEIEPSDLPF